MQTLKKRIKSKTPEFFKRIRLAGLTLAGVGGSILIAPVALPAVIVVIAGYMTVAGGVAAAVSQLAHGGE